MEPNSSHSVLEVVTALTQRGRVEEAVDFLVNVAVIAESYEVDNLSVLELTIEEYLEALYPKQLPRIRGRWDMKLYGEAVFR